MDETATAKRIWRKELRRRIAGLDPAERRRKSARIVAFIRERVRRERPGFVALFAPMPVEPDLMELLWEPGTWVFPRVDGERLTFWSVAERSHLSPQISGLWEPDQAHCALIQPSQIDWVLTPGLGFGRDGSRLGRGKGFYDRFFTETAARPIGVAFGEQVEAAMPRDEWDRPMAELVTEEGWWPCGPEDLTSPPLS